LKQPDGQINQSPSNKPIKICSHFSRTQVTPPTDNSSHLRWGKEDFAFPTKIINISVAWDIRGTDVPFLSLPKAKIMRSVGADGRGLRVRVVDAVARVRCHRAVAACRSRRQARSGWPVGKTKVSWYTAQWPVCVNAQVTPPLSGRSGN